MDERRLPVVFMLLRSWQVCLLLLVLGLIPYSPTLVSIAKANQVSIVFSQNLNRSEQGLAGLERQCYMASDEVPNAERLHLFVGLSCLYLGDIAAAIQHLDVLPANSAAYKMGRLVLGDTFLEAGDLSRAIESWRAAGAAIKLRELGTQARLAGQLDIGIAASEAGLAVWDELGADAGVLERVFLNYNLAWAWISKGALDEAEAAYQRVLVLRPNDYRAVVGLGGIYRLKRQFGAAEITLLKATHLAPDRYDAYYHLGLTASDQQDWHQAKVWLEEALVRTTNSPAQQRIRETLDMVVRHLGALP